MAHRRDTRMDFGKGGMAGSVWKGYRSSSQTSRALAGWVMRCSQYS